MNIEVVTFQDWRKEKFDKEQVVVTVSKSTTWSKGLSPFIIGPCQLYDGNVAIRMENAWQYSKVYSEFMEDNDTVGDKYFSWAKNGWDSSLGQRYPVGKGRKPLFSYWKVGDEYERLGYIDARKRIYIPLYYKAVKDTVAFKRLKEKYEELKQADKDLYLVDFDAYRHRKMGMSYTDVINDGTKTMGHAFVLAMMLETPERIAKAIERRES